jgi:hypothetical protein
MCFDEFNEKGGAVVPLQTGGFKYFARAVVLAIYADHPAAIKCAVVGKACPQCFTPEEIMNLPPAFDRPMLRTDASTKRMADTLSHLRDTGNANVKKRAKTRARKLGVNLDTVNAWALAAGRTWVFGPHGQRDCLYQCLPQVVLHGMDEGITAKLAQGVLEMAIEMGYLNNGMFAARVCHCG